MAFIDFPFAHAFKFTGALPDTVYIDLIARGERKFTKTLTAGSTPDEFVLSLTAQELTFATPVVLTGDLIVVVGGKHWPIARIAIDAAKSLTERRP